MNVVTIRFCFLSKTIANQTIILDTTEKTKLSIGSNIIHGKKDCHFYENTNNEDNIQYRR